MAISRSRRDLVLVGLMLLASGALLLGVEFAGLNRWSREAARLRGQSSKEVHRRFFHPPPASTCGPGPEACVDSPCADLVGAQESAEFTDDWNYFCLVYDSDGGLLRGMPPPLKEYPPLLLRKVTRTALRLND